MILTTWWQQPKKKKSLEKHWGIAFAGPKPRLDRRSGPLGKKGQRLRCKQEIEIQRRKTPKGAQGKSISSFYLWYWLILKICFFCVMLSTRWKWNARGANRGKLYSPNTRSYCVAATNITYEPIDSIAPSLNKIEPKKQVHVYNI